MSLVICTYCCRDDDPSGDKCKHCGSDDITPAREFNLLFTTRIGATQDTGSDVYMRPGMCS